MKVEAIEKREDVSPKEGESKYGSDANFADAKNKKYPLDTEAHVRAALSYWGMSKNRAKYSAEDQKTIGGKIRAAAKKLGIETSDNGDGEKDKAESSLVYAATSVDLEGQTPEEIVYMPKGESITIKPKRPGHEVKVKVDATVAQVLQTDLEKRLDAEIQPYAGYDHNAGPASFHPKEFRWDDERGVILAVDWTEGGKQDVTGRNYSYFSPTFMLSKSGKVAGLPDDGEVGSLVNNPAFRDRKMKIAASADDDAQEGENMTAIAEKLVELEVITAEQADDPETVIKAITDMHVTIGLVQAANARLQSENTALQAKVAEVQKAEATTVIEAAIAEGKIPAKNQDAIDFWMSELIANPERAKKAMAATLQANPLLQKVIDVKVSDTKRVAGGQSDADLVQAQHLAIDEVCAKNPGMTRAKAFDIAKREKPHVFPVEA